MTGIGRASIALSILLALGTASALGGSDPASAGSASDPEIVDVCPETTSDDVFPFADVCAAWFEAIWTPASNEQGDGVGWEFEGLRATLEMAGDVNERSPRTWAYAMAWQAGGCRNLWYLRDVAGVGEARAFLGEHCDGAERYFPLQSGQVDVSNRRIVVTLSKPDLLQLSSPYTEGVELTAPSAHVQVNVEVDGLGQVAQDWEEAGPGRSFLIGQDKPQSG